MATLLRKLPAPTGKTEYYKGYRFHTGWYVGTRGHCKPSLFQSEQFFVPEPQNSNAQSSLVNRRFGDCVAVECLARNRSMDSWWWGCRCDCGTKFAALSRNLLRGATKSCGCRRGGNRECEKR